MEAIRAETALHWPIKEKQAANANTFVSKKDSNAIDRGQAPAEPGTKSEEIQDKEKQMALVAIAAVGLAGCAPTGESSSTASSSLEAVSSSSEEGVASSESAASNGRKRAL